MDTFIWPFSIFLLALPLLVRLFFPGVSQDNGPAVMALRVPFFDRVQKFSTLLGKGFASHSIAVLLVLSWIFFVLAAMRPVAYQDAVPQNQDARNIMLAIDASGSMAQKDFDINGLPVSRLSMVKKVVTDFIKRRTNDAIGMVIFGSEAYTYAPLSFDKKTLQLLFDEVSVGIAGPQTAIGDAIALAVQGVSKAPKDSRIVILLSDGYANAGQIPVDKAIELAQKQDVKVYTVGMGSNQQIVNSLVGMIAVNPALDLDEKLLQEIAHKTGGQYFRAKSSDELAQIYQVIDQLERVEIDPLIARPRTELFYLPLSASMFLLLIAYLIRRRRA